MEQINTPRQENPGKVSPALILFLVFPLFGILAAVAVALANQPRTANGPARAPVEQQPPRLMDWQAPDFALADLNGYTVRLADLRGRMVFVNFWATWCAPCVDELPALQQFAGQQGAGGAAVLAINYDETPDVIAPFLADLHIDRLTVLLDSQFDARTAYGVNQLPTTYIVDSAGTVRYMKLGALTLDQMNEYLRLLTR